MRREVIARRFSEAAGLGREHGGSAGQAAARGLVNLAAAALTVALLLLAIIAVTVLWFLLLYAWFILFGGMLGGLSVVWDFLATCWPCFAVLGLVLYGLRWLWCFPCDEK